MTDQPHDDRGQLDRVLEILRQRGRPVAHAEPMAGDVSRRRYVRLTLSGQSGSSTLVLALYPPDLGGACERSLTSGRLLHEAGVRVATVLDADCAGSGPDGGWVVLEDLGEQTLYDLAAHPWTEIEPFFEAAVDLLPRFAGLPRNLVEPLNPPLDRELLLRELTMTRDVFLVPSGLGVEPRLWRALEHLCEALGDEPPVPCHRDYGARNLLPLPADASALSLPPSVATVGVLDHQDLRMGPPLYDLASLLNDSLFPPAEAEERLLSRALSALRPHGGPAEPDAPGGLGGPGAPDARSSYHRAAAQRTLKAVGSYAAFARRGGSRHVSLIGPTLGRALEHLRRAPETAAVAPELAARWSGAGGEPRQTP